MKTCVTCLTNFADGTQCPTCSGLRFPPTIVNKKQVGGDHYSKHVIQPWQIIEEYNLDFFEGNALKYLLRHREKNGLEDLKKLQHYVEKIIERAEKSK